MKITQSYLKKLINEEVQNVLEGEQRASYHDRGYDRDELDREAGFGDPDESSQPVPFEDWIDNGDERLDNEAARADGIFLQPISRAEYGRSQVETAKWWGDNSKKYRKDYIPNFKKYLYSK